MKLSNNTKTILKNFASINPNLVIEKGNKVATHSPNKKLYAEAQFDETFDNEFGIYDLNEFLSVCSLSDDCEISFSGNKVIIKSKNFSVKYRTSSKDCLNYPEKKLKAPEFTNTLQITEDQLNQINKAASVLGKSDMSLVADGSRVVATVLDTKDREAHQFSLNIGETTDEFEYTFLLANLRMLPGDYTIDLVDINGNKLSCWTNSNLPVRYFVAPM